MFRSHAFRSVALICTLLISAMMLAGCGDHHLGPHVLLDDTTRIESYSGAAYQSPNYHPYETGSHAYEWAGTIYIGSDLEPQENLRRVYDSPVSGNQIYMGRSRDGIGVARLKNYETDLITQDGSVHPLLSDDGFFPFRERPAVLIGQGFATDDIHYAALQNVIHILNDTLPPEFQLKLWAQPIGDYDPANTILVEALSPAEIQSKCSAAAVACASASTLGGYSQHARVFIPNDFAAGDWNYALSTIAHEMLHALGIWGHVDSIEFPDSIMGTYGEYFPNLGFVLSRIDREALQIMYMSQRTDVYNDFDEWSDTSFHIMGRSEDEAVNFGVALFNGLPQPWARGVEPKMHLADNPYLTGRVSWVGDLVGFSGVSPIIGGAKLDVLLHALEQPQNLRFWDIAFLNRQGEDRWFPTRNLDFQVDILSNGRGFRHSSDEGHIAGAFLGDHHEGMAGTIKRTDLVGAFGGTRP